MVCAMQELCATVSLSSQEPQQQQQQQQHSHQQEFQQQQHQQQQENQQNYFNSNNQQATQTSSQQQKIKTILLVTNNATTLGTEQKQHEQQENLLIAVKSQQLKKQHASLVKLLESAPITSTTKFTLGEPINKTITPTSLATEQRSLSSSMHDDLYAQQQQQQHKRLNNHVNISASVVPATTFLQQQQPKLSGVVVDYPNNKIINMNKINFSNNSNFMSRKKSDEDLLTTNLVSIKNENGNQQSYEIYGNSLGKNLHKMDNESGIDDEDVEMENANIEERGNFNNDEHDGEENYEHYQCPWKKIRYAREWKQREQQKREQQQREQQQKEQNVDDKEQNIEIKTVHNLNFQKTQQEYGKENPLHQKQQQETKRRDSTDSSSSYLSTSSTHSTNRMNKNLKTLSLNYCTCDTAVLAVGIKLANDHEQQQQKNDTDSGCDDELLLCETHQQQQQQQQQQQMQMNYLCQKFDENLETGEQNRKQEGVEDNENNIEGFFRRSIQQKIQYRPCTKNQQCSILRINRNRCQYCRLKKCIAVGMSRDAVRFGRVPKREKARILAAMQQSTQNRGQQRALATELDDQPRLLAAVLRAHLDTCEFTKEKVMDMRQRARECPSFSMPTLLACPLNPAPELQSEQEFSQRFAHIIRGVIDFAGMIPGFQLLTQDDKFTLLKAGLFDALFVRLICMFDSSINSIICLNGQVMRRDAIQNGANARFLVDSTFNFAERMNSMNLSDAEIGLFCAIVLITPDRPGLRNIELIEKMYSRLKGCLQTIIQQNRPDQPDFMAKLLDTMPDLRTLSTLHTEKLVVFRTEHKEMLRQQMWTIDDVETRSSSKSPINTASTANVWLQQQQQQQQERMLPANKSTVSSTDCAHDTTTTTTTASTNYVTSQHLHSQQPSSLASSAPLLAATLSGNTGNTCPLRQRANSGSSGDSGAADLDLIVGSHAHLTQNGLTITPIVRATPQQQQQQQQHQHQQQQQQHHHLTGAGAVNRYRKLDSPTDSGIESGNEKNECVGVSKPVSSGGSSSCSSPRSSVDDALDCSEGTNANATSSASSSSGTTATTSTTPPNSLKRQMVDDMPVLKRVLQAPPLYDTNSLMDEAYKPHKKFRALRHREYESAEADASSSTNSANTGSSIVNISNTTLSTQQQQQHQQQAQQQQAQQQQQQQQESSIVGSQLHMHLTRPPTALQTNTSSSSSSSSSSTSSACSSLSSTHSVLAKSLLAEPRMTPEQMKRSDIIQNYIMRDSTPSSSTTPNGPGSRSPAPPTVMGSPQPLHAHLQPMRHVNTPTNSNLGSPPPPPPPPVTPTRGGWIAAASVITTSSSGRQQSLSPGINHGQQQQQQQQHHHQYFQSPHSTSTSNSSCSASSSSGSSSPPPPPPHHLLELQVEIADSQQPLNLSKKSPTPPPNKLQALVAAATVVQQQQQQQQQQQHRYPTVVSADVNTTKNSPSSNRSSTPTNTVLQQHKVLLEA